jgi:hypothetical protein
MTREEALEQLRLGPGINEDVSEEYDKATDMAIEALERENILDKIRAEIEQEPYVSKMGVLDIIDKYMVEGEE